MKSFAQVVISMLMLCGTVGAVASEDRINLWPIFYSDPPDSMGCFPLFYKDRGEFISLPVCWGPEYATVPLALSWYSQTSAGREDYIGLLGLFDLRLDKGAYDRSWLFPLYYHDAGLFLSPFAAWGDESIGVPAALSWRSKHGAFETYCGLLGIGGLKLGEKGYDSSWLLPLYYHDAEGAFLSPLAGWCNGIFGIPLALSWYRKKGASETYCGLLGAGGLHLDGGDYGSSWLLPLYYHDSDENFFSLLYSRTKSMWCLPALLSGHSQDSDGNETWLSIPLLSSVRTQHGDLRSIDVAHDLLFSADYDEAGCTNCVALAELLHYSEDRERGKAQLRAFLLAGYETHESRYVESHFLPFYVHKASDRFLSIPYARWRGEHDRTNELYGLLAFRSNGPDYSRFNILWKFFDYERENGTTRVDFFPGVTCDVTPDGTCDFSLWYRFFRYRSTPQGLSDLSILFIPFK